MASMETREYRMAFCRVSEGEILHLVDDPAIHQQKPVRPEGLRVPVDSSHNRLDRHASMPQNHLAAIDPGVPGADGGRLPDRAGTPSPVMGGDDREQLQERLQPERTGPDRVLMEVRLKEPLGRIDLFGSADESEPV